MSATVLADRLTLRRHAGETLRIGLPLAAAQLAQMAMGVTDTVLLGRLGPDALAAGGLGISYEIMVVIVLQGVISAVSIFVAQARGAGRNGDVPALFWTATLLSVLLCIPAFFLMSVTEPLLLAIGEPAALAHDAGTFVSVLRWCVPGSMIGMGLMRAFLPAIDAGWLILPVMLAATVLNAMAGYSLIHGVWFLPPLGMRGPAVATVIVSVMLAGSLCWLTAATPARRALTIWTRPRLDLLKALLRLGLPIGAIFAVEAGLFVAVALMIGLQGQVALAAQQVAFTTVSIWFMIPLGLAQAGNVRVGLLVGAADRLGARSAGLVAIGLAGAVEAVAACVSWLIPDPVVSLFLGDDATGTHEIAVSLLGIAALFQVADGVQCAAGGALRGLGDTRVPFLLAAIGYWAIGFPAAWALTMKVGMGPQGAWWGLAAGLTVTAILLTLRFVRRTTRTIGLSRA